MTFDFDKNNIVRVVTREGVLTEIRATRSETLLQEPERYGVLVAPADGAMLSGEQLRVAEGVSGVGRSSYPHSEGSLLYGQEAVEAIQSLPGQPRFGAFLYGESGNGHVFCFFWTPSYQRGFGGRTYTREVGEGLQVTVKGPWSSSAEAINAAGLGPVVEISLPSPPRHSVGSWCGGYGGVYWLRSAADDLVLQARERDCLVED